MAGKPKDENGTVKKIVVALSIILISGFITWVAHGIITGKIERAEAATERSYICKNIDEIKRGITDLKKHFNLP